MRGRMSQSIETSTTENSASQPQMASVRIRVMGRLNLLKAFIVSLRLRKFARFYCADKGLSTV